MIRVGVGAKGNEGVTALIAAAPSDAPVALRDAPDDDAYPIAAVCCAISARAVILSSRHPLRPAADR